MKFSVGERVVVYYINEKDKGIVSGILDNNLLKIMVDTPNGFRFVTAHPKQCRRLKKREPRRRVWVRFYESGHADSVMSGSPDKEFFEWHEFIEVRKRTEK
jgi:hypothetical protein